MKRSTLDDVSRELDLSETAVALALDLTGARPDASAWLAFKLRLLNGAGIGALAAGIIFFVAANWQDYGLTGRFAILQMALLACVGPALWRPPPSALGQATLVLAVLVTGALLALFGQSYQTGADLYELFFTWAALALPFALAGGCGAVWATWWIVLDVGLALYCGLQGPNASMWMWLDHLGAGRSQLMMGASLVNLAGAALFVHLGRTRFADHAPRWLPRMLATFGFLFGTIACIFVIVHDTWLLSHNAAATRLDAGVIAAFAVLSVGIAIGTLRARTDVFPMALIAASWIAVSTAFLIRTVKLGDMGGFLLIALWLVAASTAAGFLLMRWVRAWRVSA